MKSNYNPTSEHCQNCQINSLCIAAHLGVKDLAEFDKIVEHPKALKKSETAFYAGEELKYLYAIRKGSIKTFNISMDGEEQITGFHQAGELIGIDGLASKRHKSFAKALETTEICAIPYKKLESLSLQIPQLHEQLMHVMSNEIAKQYDLMLTLNQRAADQRVAAFLLNMNKQTFEKSADSKLVLNMTRAEIGNYLGLALETVSRLMSKFKKEQLIELNRREVNLIDFPKLQAIAGIEDYSVAA